jgi:glucoamylase
MTAVFVLVIQAWVQAALPDYRDSRDSVTAWIARETPVAEARLIANLSPEDGLPGSVVASPTRNDPDYYWNWVRDAAIVADWAVSAGGYEPFLFDFVEFNRHLQTAPAQEGLGEPRFSVHGHAFNGDWGRPQNDSPALRLIAIGRFALKLLESGRENLVWARLWPVMKPDAAYVAGHWWRQSFDLWEEVKGEHFYTIAVSRRALLVGAQVFRRLGAFAEAEGLELEAERARESLSRFVSRTEKKASITATLNQTGGLHGKAGLDSAVILASLHGNGPETPICAWAPSDPLVLNTLHDLQDAFRKLYAVNFDLEAPLLGRYAEDTYRGGNPWILTTFAAAELHYRAAAELLQVKDTAGFRVHCEEGDRFMRTLRIFIERLGGAMPEQLDRRTGAGSSAADLSWSYVAFLTAAKSREACAPRD